MDSSEYALLFVKLAAVALVVWVAYRLRAHWWERVARVIGGGRGLLRPGRLLGTVAVAAVAVAAASLGLWHAMAATIKGWFTTFYGESSPTWADLLYGSPIVLVVAGTFVVGLVRWRTVVLGGAAVATLAALVMCATPRESFIQDAEPARQLLAPTTVLISAQFTAAQQLLVMVGAWVSGLLVWRWSRRPWGFPVGAGVGAALALRIATPIAATGQLLLLTLGIALVALAMVAMSPVRQRLESLAGVDVHHPWSARHEVAMAALVAITVLGCVFAALHDHVAREVIERQTRAVAPIAKGHRNGFELMGPMFHRRDVVAQRELARYGTAALMPGQRGIDDLYGNDDLAVVLRMHDELGRAELSAALAEQAPLIDAFAQVRHADYFLAVREGRLSVPSFLAVRESARLLVIRAGLASGGGNHAAALSDLELLLVFGDLANNGSMVQVMVSTAVRGLAIHGIAVYLQAFRENDAALAAGAAMLDRFRSANLRPMPLGEIRDHEFLHPLITPYSEFTVPSLLRANAIYARNANHFVELEIGFALERHRLAYGSYPADLAELVPAYIPHPPLDCFTGAPFRYTSSGDSYSLTMNLESLDHELLQFAKSIRLQPSPPPSQEEGEDPAP